MKYIAILLFLASCAADSGESPSERHLGRVPGYAVFDLPPDDWERAVSRAGHDTVVFWEDGGGNAYYVRAYSRVDSADRRCLDTSCFGLYLAPRGLADSVYVGMLMPSGIRIVVDTIYPDYSSASAARREFLRGLRQAAAK